MDIKEIIEKNKEYREKENELKILYRELKEINDSITGDMLNGMSYLELKEFSKLSKFAFSSDKQKEFDLYFKNRREEEFPKLKGVIYFPVIDEIDFISEDKKIALDRFFNKVRKGTYFVPTTNKFFTIGLSRELSGKILDFLYEKGMFERLVKLKCYCGEDAQIIKQSEYDEYIRYLSLTDDEFAELNEEEEEKYFKFSDGIYISCNSWDCDMSEYLKTVEELDKRKSYVYKFVATPDSSSDEL